MLSQLETLLGYRFRQSELLQVALTHRSAGSIHNERLEFLGDSIVNFVIAELLFKQFVVASEGELSRWRASLINRTTLAELANLFSLSEYLILGQGELRSGGNRRESILSCAMEAIIGAIYLDAGMQVVHERITAWYEPRFLQLQDAASHKDPKSQLQEYLQHEHLPLPQYTVDKMLGEAHQQLFYIRCEVQSLGLSVIGQGSSRKRAEQDAAHLMLAAIKARGRL